LSPTKERVKLSTILQQSDTEEAGRQTLQLSNRQIEFNDAAVRRKAESNVNRTESKRMLLLKMQGIPASQNSTKPLTKSRGGFFPESSYDFCSSQRPLASLDFSRKRYCKYPGLMDMESFLQSPYQNLEDIVNPLCRPGMSKSGNVASPESKHPIVTVDAKPSVGTTKKSTTFRVRRSCMSEIKNTKISQGNKQSNQQRLPSLNQNSTREENERVLISYVNNEEITLTKHQRKGRSFVIQYYTARSSRGSV
jgi:hypothetical protein